MKFKMYRYLNPTQVEYILKHHLPHIHYWKHGDDFGLKYDYIEMRKLMHQNFKEAVEVDYNPKEDTQKLYLIQTKKGYSLTGLHGYNTHFELVETIKYGSLWNSNPKEWKKICKEASI